MLKLKSTFLVLMIKKLSLSFIFVFLSYLNTVLLEKGKSATEKLKLTCLTILKEIQNVDHLAILVR